MGQKLLKRLFEIDEQDRIGARIEPLKITVVAIVKTPHQTRSVEKAAVAEAVAVTAPFVQKLPLSAGEDQFFGAALGRKALRRTVENLFVVSDHDNVRTIEFLDDTARLRVVENRFFDVKMRKEPRRARRRGMFQAMRSFRVWTRGFPPAEMGWETLAGVDGNNGAHRRAVPPAPR